MKKLFFILLFLEGFVLFSQEKQYFSNNGSLTFDTKNYNFNIVLVSNLAEALEKWNDPDKSGNSYIVSTMEVKIDDPIAILIIFTPKKENVNLTYNFSTLKANGVFSEKKINGLVIYNGKTKKNIALHGKALPVIIFRNDDPIGKYQFHLEIYDSGKFLGKAILEFEVKAK
jgi:hypothetical protein